jgi:hypothetical protein
MKEPTKKEMRKIVEFLRDGKGNLFINNVKGDILGTVWGNVGNVRGNIAGSVSGTICGRKWQLTETRTEKIIRLIREGKVEEAIYLLRRVSNDND